MQNLTPIDIQKQTFSKRFRGYDEGEVRAFLHLVAEDLATHLQEIERLSREVADIRSDLEKGRGIITFVRDFMASAVFNSHLSPHHSPAVDANCYCLPELCRKSGPEGEGLVLTNAILELSRGRQGGTALNGTRRQRQW